MAFDGLGEKLKSLFKTKEDPRFKGQGRRLGTAETNSSNTRPHQPQLLTGGSRNADQAGVLDTCTVPTEQSSPLKPPPQPLGPGGGRPALVLSRSHRTEDVVLDAAVMANTPTSKEAATGPTGPWGPSQASRLACRKAAVQGAGMRELEVAVAVALIHKGLRRQRMVEGVGVVAGEAGGVTIRGGLQTAWWVVSTISTPTAAEKRMGGFRCPAPPTDGAMADYGLAPATSQAYELQRCLALVLSSQLLSTSNLSTLTTSSSVALTAVSAVPAGGAPAAAPAEASSSTPASLPSGDPAAAAAAADHSIVQLQLQPQSSGLAAQLQLQIRLSNPRVQEAIVGVPGGVEFLEAAGKKAGEQGLGVLRGETWDLLITDYGSEACSLVLACRVPAVPVPAVGDLTPSALPHVHGFQMRFWPDDGSELANQGYLFLPDDVPPTALAEPFRILSAVMAAHGFMATTTTTTTTATTTGTTTIPTNPEPTTTTTTATAGATTLPPSGYPQPQTQTQHEHMNRVAGSQAAVGGPFPEPVPAVERCTQVFLPVAADVEVPDWFFDRTGSEVREQWAAMVRKREEAERFMTRTMREVRRQQEAAAAAAAAAAASGGVDKNNNLATVRVRFPEGVCLQGSEH
ncbi:hypothetical protein VOLCADRAFT_93297 [Volvox carteri f. nagariensis]|uniref:Uncharacterized protein n=1 Tax=Volvox carteri f. nagariensis TaxID=3068 RepID=D8U1S0_VOLCA|nr:uncharacterized protein VOLCADRAFT_93297 [Volvox carteri f. nagariensis]EFJ46390.1 hypothetical protein VOLCADRAFT_93297 [Volvox carteri f. nagariensis]|eukprot:XP_002952543.1 hypothetical protein VOLCADRAFT_93297 [Volvox carteri f. nagariensis]